jgi:hypothetical protein
MHERLTVIHRCAWAAIAAGLLCALASCSEPPPPRSREEIFRQRMELPALYLTAKTHKRVIAPMSRGIFEDPDSGETCWPALACTRPDCPGRGADGEPYLFIEPDTGVPLKPDGTPDYDVRTTSAQLALANACPACAKQRDLASETEEQRRQYHAWVELYVLPETAAAIDELDAELKRRNKLDRRRRADGPLTEEDGKLKPIPEVRHDSAQ